jgi:O-antigen ligase
MLNIKKSAFWVLASLVSWSVFSFLSNSLLATNHICILLGSFLALKRFSVRQMPFNFFALTLLAVACVFSVLVNWGNLHAPFSNLLKTKYIFFSIALLFLCLSHKKEIEKFLPHVLVVFLLGFSLASLRGIFGYFVEHLIFNNQDFRLNGFFGMVLSFSYTAGFPLLLQSYLYFNKDITSDLKKALPKFLSWYFECNCFRFFLCLSFLAVVFSWTRGAFIGIAFAFPVLIFSVNKRAGYLSLLVGFCLMCFSLFYISGRKEALPISISDRLFTGMQNSSNQMRLNQLKVGWKIFQEKPFLGIGYRSFEERDSYYKQKNNLPFVDMPLHAHNNFIEFLATTGLIGFLCYLTWLIGWGWVLWTRRNYLWGPYFIAIYVYFLVSGLFQSTFIDSEFAFTFFALYALSHILPQSKFKKV